MGRVRTSRRPCPRGRAAIDAARDSHWVSRNRPQHGISGERRPRSALGLVRVLSPRSAPRPRWRGGSLGLIRRHVVASLRTSWPLSYPRTARSPDVRVGTDGAGRCLPEALVVRPVVAPLVVAISQAAAMSAVPLWGNVWSALAGALGPIHARSPSRRSSGGDRPRHPRRDDPTGRRHGYFGAGPLSAYDLLPATTDCPRRTVAVTAYCSTGPRAQIRARFRGGPEGLARRPIGALARLPLIRCDRSSHAP